MEYVGIHSLFGKCHFKLCPVVVVVILKWLYQRFAGLVVLSDLQVVDVEVARSLNSIDTQLRTLATLGQVDGVCTPVFLHVLEINQFGLLEILLVLVPVEQCSSTDGLVVFYSNRTTVSTPFGDIFSQFTGQFGTYGNLAIVF